MSTPNKKNHVPAVASNNVLMQGLTKVNTQLQTLSVIFGATFRTNGESKLSQLNIQQAKNMAMLISILGQLQTKEREYNTAGESLKLNTFPVFQWEGYPLDAWQHDIALRISQITQAEKEKELKSIQKDLTELMDKEDKLAILTARLERLG